MCDLLSAIAIIMHPIIDVTSVYGEQTIWPFSPDCVQGKWLGVNFPGGVSVVGQLPGCAGPPGGTDEWSCCSGSALIIHLYYELKVCHAAASTCSWSLRMYEW